MSLVPVATKKQLRQVRDNYLRAIALDHVVPFRLIQESSVVEKRAVIAAGVTPPEGGQPISVEEKRAEYIRRHGELGQALFEEDQKILKQLETNSSTRLSEAAEKQASRK